MVKRSRNNLRVVGLATVSNVYRQMVTVTHLLNHLQHHQLISLPQTQLKILLQVREELRALPKFLVNWWCRAGYCCEIAATALHSAQTARPCILDRISPCDIAVE